MKKSKSSATRICALSLVLLVGALSNDSSAAPGDVDLSFGPGSGVNGPVFAVAVQPGGKIIIGGTFTTVKGLQRFKVARLNADGSGDSSFDPGASLAELSNYYWYVSSVVLQPDGKVLIGGGFIITGENGTNWNNGLARLNADGSLDTTFNMGFGVQAIVSSIALQPDGKVLIGADSGVIRLNTNGTLDNSFNSAAGISGVISIAVQPDGKVLVGGSLYNSNGMHYGIARLNANGSRDSSFNPGSGANSIVRSIALQTDLKILIGGDFGQVNGTNRNQMARLNVDGSLDLSFNPNTGVGSDSHVVDSIAVQSDGKVLIGSYSSPANLNRNGIARLNANGSLDSSFNPGTGANADVYSVVIQSNGKVLLGGVFTFINGTNRNRMARLNADGGIDGSFDPGRGSESSFSSLVALPSGKVLVGGVFTYSNGTNQNGGLRLNADGSLDPTFVPDTNFNPGLFGKHYQDCGPDFECYDITSATAAALQPDGKVVVGVGSEFWQCDPAGGGCNFSVSYFLMRLNGNGSRDTNFLGTNVSVTSIAVRSDGKLLVGGAKIIRLNADGSPDSSFNPGTGPNAGVTSVALQPDGKGVVFWGDFIEWRRAKSGIKTQSMKSRSSSCSSKSFFIGSQPQFLCWFCRTRRVIRNDCERSHAHPRSRSTRRTLCRQRIATARL